MTILNSVGSACKYYWTHAEHAYILSVIVDLLLKGRKGENKDLEGKNPANPVNKKIQFWCL